MLNLTDVRIRLMEKPEGKMRAIVAITIDDCFVIHDIKVIMGDNGLFIAMPSTKKKDGEFKDVAHPINSETRTQLEKAIIDKYNEEVAKPHEA